MSSYFNECAVQPLFEQYRPRTWSELVGQDKIVAKVELLRRRGLGGRSFWITGSSGSGKSTIARLLASEIAEDWNIEELDASELTPAALREVERSMQTRGLGTRSGRAYLINESHGLRRDTIRQLLVVLERLPSHVMFVFCTTNDNESALFEDCLDGSPLTSRCIELPLSRRDLSRPFAERVQAIAQAEQLDGRPLADYLALAKRCRNNMRAMLCAVESGAMIGNADCAT